MTNDFYDIDALIAAGTYSVLDDGGIDWIVVSALHVTSFPYPGSQYGTRIVLDGPGGDLTVASATTIRLNPPLYTTVNFTGTIENVMGGAGNDEIRGNLLANVLQGDAADVEGMADLIVGGGGADTIIGGGGEDWLFGGEHGDLIFGDINPEEQSANYSGANDQLSGDAGDDTLHGGQGQNLLDGGDGIDTADYGYWSETQWASYYIVVEDNRVTVRSVDAYDGTETVVGTDLLVNVERIVGTAFADTVNGPGSALNDPPFRIYEMGAGNDSVWGSSVADDIYGGEGDDTLQGAGYRSDGAYHDRLFGGRGNDSYTWDNYYADTEIVEGVNEGHDRVTAFSSYTLPENVEDLYITGRGRAVGNALANRIECRFDADTLDGRGGADTLIGDGGNDVYHIDKLDTVIELAGGGIDEVISGMSQTVLMAEVENLTLRGSAVTGVGNGLDNRLTGTGAANVLDGMAGVDTLVGGNGNDTFVLRDGLDTILETATGGTDMIWAMGVDVVLPDFVENAVVRAPNLVHLTGNTLANVLTGSVEADYLSGMDGKDTLFGGDGDDGLKGGRGDDALYGGKGRDTADYAGSVAVTIDLRLTVAQNTGRGMDILQGIENLIGSGASDLLIGNTGNNVLEGRDGSDTLLGGRGADWFYGGRGNDSLTGGADSDVFVFRANEGSDVVTDFRNGVDFLAMGSFADVSVQDLGADTRLVWSGTQVTLVGVDAALIDAADFIV